MRRIAWLLLMVGVALPLAVSAQAPADKRLAVPLEGSPALGPADAPLTVVEFLDFQ